jgi:type I site-specific restriction endonuclease
MTDPTESQTRKALIDPALRKAGWEVDNPDQIHFLRAVQNVFLQRRRLVLADPYEPPLTSFGQDAVERWFSTEEVNEVLEFVDTLTVVSRSGSS